MNSIDEERVSSMDEASRGVFGLILFMLGISFQTMLYPMMDTSILLNGFLAAYFVHRVLRFFFENFEIAPIIKVPEEWKANMKVEKKKVKKE